MLELDNTENKSNLGANAILSVSLACAKAASLELDVPLHNYISKLNYKKGKNKMPIPFLNIINGGAHAGTELAFQEFQIVPHKKTFSENIRISCETYHTLKDIISRKYGAGSTNVGLEGGFALNINDPKDALDLMEDAIIKAGNKKEITIGLDVAASEIYNNKKYLVNSKKYSSEEMMDYYSSLLKSYNITSIEDPLSEDDKLSWPIFTKSLEIRLQ